MNYLYFDIECCDGRNICSFGYVLVDNMFNLIKKKDIIINPEAKFKLGRKDFDPEIDLAYSYKDFKCHKNFACHYDKIKAILTQKDIVILGHSVNNDILFLDIACERYKLPKINILAYDTQAIASKYDNNSKNMSLENIATKLEIDLNKLSLHKSCDDAYLTMLIIEKICKKCDLNIDELLKQAEDTRKTNDLNADENITKTVSIRQIANKYPNRNKWPAICFSETIKLNQLKICKQLLDKQYNYIRKASECNYFVYGNEVGKRDYTCDDRIAKGANIKKITILEFEKMTNIKIMN